MTFDELMTYIGVKIPAITAGAAGGVVKALVFHKDRPIETVLSGVVGGLTANYLGEVATDHLVSWGIKAGIGASSFVVGLTAMVICQTLMDVARRWRRAANDNPQKP